MKLTALQLCVIQETLTQSLKISNFSGQFTAKSRENVRDVIATIMSEIKLEIITDSPSPNSITADTGV